MRKLVMMKGKMGVWIDLEQAVLIAIDGDDHTIKTIKSAVETRVREPGEGKQFGRFGDQYVDPERKHQERRKQQIRQFTHDVSAHLSNAEEIVIFGPAEMKYTLGKTVKEQPVLAPRLKEIVTTDSMTENQMVAWVRSYFIKR